MTLHNDSTDMMYRRIMGVIGDRPVSPSFAAQCAMSVPHEPKLRAHETGWLCAKVEAPVGLKVPDSTVQNVQKPPAPRRRHSR